MTSGRRLGWATLAALACALYGACRQAVDARGSALNISFWSGALDVAARQAADAPSGTVAEMVQSTTPVGVCVHIGTTDGALEEALAADGRLLVQGLALDDKAVAAARKRLIDRGIYGLASVEKVRTFGSLPYSEHLINALVVDADALGTKAPSAKEIMRVLAPGGVAHVRKDGTWTKTVKARPAGMDDWPQHYHNAAMNPVAKDTLVAPSSSVKWIADYFEEGASHSANSGVIISGGKAFYVYRVAHGTRGVGGRLVCRDAYNGARCWSLDVANDVLKQGVLAAGNVVYCVLEQNGPLAALDGDTGKVLRRYEAGGRSWNQQNGPQMLLPTVYHEATLYQTAADTIYALDAATGALRWKHTEEGGKHLFFPTVGDGKVFIARGPKRYGVWRLPSSEIDAVVALDLGTGKRLWVNEDGAGLNYGQFAYHDGSLALFTWKGIGAKGDDSLLRCIDTKTGKTRWTRDYFKDFKIYVGPSAVAMFRDGELQLGAHEGFVAYDPADGKIRRKVTNKVPGVSSYQCNTSRATTNYLLSYSTVFTDNEGRAERKFISRSTCGTGVFPANGMVYTTTNYCGCHMMLRGYMALASEPVGTAVPDAERLEKGPAAARFVQPANWPKGDEWPTFLGDSRRRAATAGGVGKTLQVLWQRSVADGSRLPATSLVRDWTENDQHKAALTPPIVADGTAFVAVPAAHTLHALDAVTGARRWSFTAGARVGPPTVYGGLCLIASHDGYVYALNAADGTQAWRFLAGVNHRQMVAYSQLESIAPVMSTVTIANGAAFVVAGRHPQADGGLAIYRLDPATGAMKWKTIHTGDLDPLPNQGTQAINDVLTTDGGLLYLKALAIDPDTGAVGSFRRGRPKLDANRPALPDVFVFPGGKEVLPVPRAQSRWGLLTSRQISWGGNLNADHWAVADGKAYAVKAAGSNSPPNTKFLTRWPDGVFIRSADGVKPEWQNDATRDDSRGKARVTGMIATADHLVVAGRDQDKGFVEIYAKADGVKQAAVELAAPVVEKGIAVAYGRIYVACSDGSVVMLGQK